MWGREKHLAFTTKKPKTYKKNNNFRILIIGSEKHLAFTKKNPKPIKKTITSEF